MARPPPSAPAPSASNSTTAPQASIVPALAPRKRGAPLDVQTDEDEDDDEQDDEMDGDYHPFSSSQSTSSSDTSMAFAPTPRRAAELAELRNETESSELHSPSAPSLQAAAASAQHAAPSSSSQHAAPSSSFQHAAPSSSHQDAAPSSAQGPALAPAPEVAPSSQGPPPSASQGPPSSQETYVASSQSSEGWTADDWEEARRIRAAVTGKCPNGGCPGIRTVAFYTRSPEQAQLALTEHTELSRRQHPGSGHGLANRPRRHHCHGVREAGLRQGGL